MIPTKIQQSQEQLSEPAHGRETKLQKKSESLPKPLEFRNGKWIDRQHNNKIQVLTAS
jgi:hypothetical protein